MIFDWRAIFYMISGFDKKWNFGIVILEAMGCSKVEQV